VNKEARMKFVEGSASYYHIYWLCANIESSWSSCPYQKCRKRRRCGFGPRGTFRRTGGIPLCRTGPLFRRWREELPGELRRLHAEWAARQAAIAERKAIGTRLDGLITDLLTAPREKA
jgi:hypothetical protein